MHGPVHPLDPNFLDFGLDHEHYIWGDRHGDIKARVDPEDFWFFSRWAWHVKWDKHGRKPYIVRSVAEWANGVKLVNHSLFLHVAIHRRSGIEQPEHHTIVDHENGDTLECRKFNLRWATPSMNRRNIRGQRSLRL